MKQLARIYVAWVGIDADIEYKVKFYQECANNRSNPSKAPLHPWAELESILLPKLHLKSILNILTFSAATW